MSTAMPRKMNYLGLCLIFSLLFLTAADGQEVYVSAEVSPQHIHLDERAMLRVTISGDTELQQIQPPQLELLPEFIASYAGLSNQYRWNGDSISPSMTWAYELIPEKVGQFTLTQIRVPYGGEIYTAAALPITVLPSLREPMQRESLPSSFTEASTGGVHKVEAFVNQSQPYVNEQIIYTFRYLYTVRLPSADLPTHRLPALTHFWVKPLSKPSRRTEVINGTTYQVEEIRLALFPITAGRTVIEPAELTLPAFVGSNPQTPKKLATRQTLAMRGIEIKVRPLPPFPQSSLAPTAVGEYQITAKVEQTTIDVGDGFTLQLEVAGTGNIETLEPPTLPTIPNLTVYAPKIRTRIEEVNAKIHGSFTYEYVIISPQPGRLILPAIEYPYFHPQRESYQIARTEPITITVRPGASAETPMNEAPVQHTPHYIWAIPVLLLIVAVWAIWGYRRLRAPSSHTPIQRQDTSETALKAIEQLATKPSVESTAGFRIIADILYQYIGDRLSISPIGLSPERVREQCQAANISDTATNRLVGILTQCDYARFAPIAPALDEMKQTLKQAREVIHQIEREWLTAES